MLNLTPLVPDGDVTVHIVLSDFGDLGRAYVETDEAAADEANLELRETNKILKPPAEPPISEGLGAWTTPPADTEPAVEAAEGSELEAATEPPVEHASNGSNTLSDSATATAENPNPNES